jgi:four helix bundle protein
MAENGYKNLIVWQKAVDLVVAVYKLTGNFPKEEIFGVVSQMRRAAISIPSNIAEGSRRKSAKDKAYFLTISFGSGSELETQVEVSRRLSFGLSSDYVKVDALIVEVMKMLNKMISY